MKKTILALAVCLWVFKLLLHKQALGPSRVMDLNPYNKL